MGYRPNVIARYLCQHKTLTIALVLPSLANPFYPEIMEAVENIVRENELVLYTVALSALLFSGCYLARRTATSRAAISI